ncbi:MAG: tRNA 4-thiouridine(8) synthase ThiI [Deltaproteobacteria bacterium]|nr:tRNA 4-thiouridine(8) synthase ThiI [Deltaproteobacteria bacterium]
MKALCAFSGGLDSLLASELLRAQGVEVLALFFETPFFSSEKAVKSAAAANLPIKIVDITHRHLSMLQDPKHGFGGYMNPCIDCHVLMIRIIGEMLQEEGASFVITGEVLGQRPMSQNIKALSMVECESGLRGLVLRPLSAKRLQPTIPEERGWVQREKLMGFSGRSRKPQMELAERLHIKEYPSPAGGCLLTDEVFSRRLKDLFSARPDFELRELELLKVGRHFRLGPNTKLVVGRNKKENQTIQTLWKESDLLMSTISVPGPTVLVSGDVSPEFADLAASMTVSYSDAKNDDLTKIALKGQGMDEERMAKGRDKDGFRDYMI